MTKNTTFKINLRVTANISTYILTNIKSFAANEKYISKYNRNNFESVVIFFFLVIKNVSCSHCNEQNRNERKQVV